eukprot:6303424-Pyramimonas_sp.AAC.1
MPEAESMASASSAWPCRRSRSVGWSRRNHFLSFAGKCRSSALMTKKLTDVLSAGTMSYSTFAANADLAPDPYLDVLLDGLDELLQVGPLLRRPVGLLANVGEVGAKHILQGNLRKEVVGEGRRNPSITSAVLPNAADPKPGPFVRQGRVEMDGVDIVNEIRQVRLQKRQRPVRVGLPSAAVLSVEDVRAVLYSRRLVVARSGRIQDPLAQARPGPRDAGRTAHQALAILENGKVFQFQDIPHLPDARFQTYAAVMRREPLVGLPDVGGAALDLALRHEGPVAPKAMKGLRDADAAQHAATEAAQLVDVPSDLCVSLVAEQIEVRGHPLLDKAKRHHSRRMMCGVARQLGPPGPPAASSQTGYGATRRKQKRRGRWQAEGPEGPKTAKS